MSYRIYCVRMTVCGQKHVQIISQLADVWARHVSFFFNLQQMGDGKGKPTAIPLVPLPATSLYSPPARLPPQGALPSHTPASVLPRALLRRCRPFLRAHPYPPARRGGREEVDPSVSPPCLTLAPVLPQKSSSLVPASPPSSSPPVGLRRRRRRTEPPSCLHRRGLWSRLATFLWSMQTPRHWDVRLPLPSPIWLELEGEAAVWDPHVSEWRENQYKFSVQIQSFVHKYGLTCGSMQLEDVENGKDRVE
jgi:hypothetical protein